MQGITGKLSGKMGSAVFRVRNGQQVVTQYNPVVANPNTKAQQGPRSKFKLLSQLAAVLSPGFGTLNVVRRPAKGTPSKRNAFIKINYPLTANDERGGEVVAEVDMAKLKLTSSTRYLGSMIQNGTDVDVQNIPEGVTKVRGCVIGYRDDKPVLLEIQEQNVTNGSASFDLKEYDENITLLAYGIIPTEGASGTAYDPLSSQSSTKPYTSAIELDELVSAGAILETETIGMDYANA